jgi:murein DD-endopeptidase MepM/ murein hydrolase activator NlpD
MKKRLFSYLLFSFLLIAQSAIAGNSSAADPGNNNSSTESNSKTDSAAKDDTVKYALSEKTVRSLLEWDVNDSLSWLPAYDVYCQWDTSAIHYHYSDAGWEDTTTLVLHIETESPYTHPCQGEVTSGFGYRRSRFHYGIDINLETGDTVVAAFDGKIRISKMNKSYGNLVVIRHNNGLETYYAHLSKLLVEPGQEVVAGQVIGLGGNTGRSYGSHLHFEVRYKGKPIDPNELIDFREKKLLSDTFCITRKHVDDLGVVKKGAPSKYSKGTTTIQKSPAAKTSAKKTAAKYHTVRSGETLTSIARKYGTTPAFIAKKNGISLKATLKVGTRIKV